MPINATGQAAFLRETSMPATSGTARYWRRWAVGKKLKNNVLLVRRQCGGEPAQLWVKAGLAGSSQGSGLAQNSFIFRYPLALIDAHQRCYGRKQPTGWKKTK